MQHRGELAIHEYLRKVSEGRSSMSKKTIKQMLTKTAINLWTLMLIV